MTATRRNISMPDDLWERAVKATLEASVKAGRPISVSEWIRGAMQEKLAKENAS